MRITSSLRALRGDSALLRALAVASLGATLPSAAQAADLLYYQDFEEANAFAPERWMTTSNCASWQHTPANPPLAVQQGEAAANECGGRFARESIRWAGGRVISRTPIPVQAGDQLCVTAWVRATGTARPFIGINYVSANDPNGFAPDQGSIGGCHNGEHWLIGDGFDDDLFRNGSCNQRPGGGYDNEECCGRSLTGYGQVTQVQRDGNWRYYTKQFTVSNTDHEVGGNGVNAGTYNRMVLKFQNWTGGDTNSCPANPAYAEENFADFDDLRVYRLNAGENCPTAADTVADGDDVHGSCGVNAPFCVSRQVGVQVNGVESNYNQFRCIGCTSSYGGAGDAVCPPASPVCDGGDAPAGGSCQQCTGDAGSAASMTNVHLCGGQQPYCNNDGSCGQCQSNNDCAQAGKERGGALCVRGACTGGCTIQADGSSPECGADRFCMPADAASNNGTCQTKLPNGDALPERAAEGANAGKCRLDADGAPVTAEMFCASGVCSKADDLCGLADGEACAAATGSVQCRAGVCGPDGACALPQYTACSNNVQCRGALECTDGFCGGPAPQCTEDSQCGTSFHCSSSGTCAPGCRGSNPNSCPAGKVCSAQGDNIGNCVDAPSSSSGGSSSGGAPDGSSSGGAPDGSSSSGTPDGSSSGGDPSLADGILSGASGCSSGSGGSAASLTPLLIGAGLALGAVRRRRRA